MKAYRVEIVIVDFDELGPDGLIEELEAVNFPNDCIHLSASNVRIAQVVDIGDWSDEHPLNRRGTDSHEWMREQDPAD